MFMLCVCSFDVKCSFFSFGCGARDVWYISEHVEYMYVLSLMYVFFSELANFRVSYLISIVRPTTEFHITMLIIKWEPRDVYLACALEDTRGHVQTTAVMFDHNICVVRTIESLIRTVYTLYEKNSRYIDLDVVTRGKKDDVVNVFSWLIAAGARCGMVLTHFEIGLCMHGKFIGN